MKVEDIYIYIACLARTYEIKRRDRTIKEKICIKKRSHQREIRQYIQYISLIKW